MKINEYMTVGISPAVLNQEAFLNDEAHLCAISQCCHFSEYDALDMHLADNSNIRRQEIKLLKEFNKSLNYNALTVFQKDGPYNAGSENPEYRKNALELMKRHLDYAAEGDAKLYVITSCIDPGAKKRAEVLKRFEEFFCACAEHVKPMGFPLVLEPLERGVFKNLLFGPTNECTDFLLRLQKMGYSNVKLMIDTAHTPLMNEDFDEEMALAMPVGLVHIHLGNAVFNSASSFYGHTHPPIGVQDGVYDVEETAVFFESMIRRGYIDLAGGKKNTVSVEIAPYPGVSHETSARVSYEKMQAAFDIACSRF